jgi:hypothetical protein
MVSAIGDRHLALAITMTSQLVPPISIEMKFAARPDSAQPLSAPTPAAGPLSTSITGRVATWSTETAPPLLCSSSSALGRPSWRSWRSSACR